MAFVRYQGTEDFRKLNSTDVPAPGYDDEGNPEAEDPWEYTWALSRGHVVEVDNAHAERILALQNFRPAGEEEIEEAQRLAEEDQAWEVAAKLRDARAIESSQNADSSVKPEDSQDSSELADAIDDQSADADDAGTDQD